MREHVSKRELEPFSFWPYSSAIPGLGGEERSPDINYCFHTLYDEYQPGTVIFTVTVHGAIASYGELAIRAHAFQPDSGRDASLVAGNRTPLEDLSGVDLQIRVRVGAVPGVQYALFGYLSEASDLRACGLSVSVEEKGGENLENYVNSDTARSLFATTPVDMPARLMADELPGFAFPVSQAMTADQISSPEYFGCWPEIPNYHGNPAMRWRQAYAVQALRVYGMLVHGANGVVIAPMLLPLVSVIRKHGCSVENLRIVSQLSCSEGSDPDEFASVLATEIGKPASQLDFAVAFIAPDWFLDKAAFGDFVMSTLRSILRGGIAIFLFDYAPDDPSDMASEAHATGFLPHRNDIEQLALRVISHGSEVAQLNFAQGRDTGRSLTYPRPFGLIVRR